MRSAHVGPAAHLALIARPPAQLERLKLYLQKLQQVGKTRQGAYAVDQNMWSGPLSYLHPRSVRRIQSLPLNPVTVLHNGVVYRGQLRLCLPLRLPQ